VLLWCFGSPALFKKGGKDKSDRLSLASKRGQVQTKLVSLAP